MPWAHSPNTWPPCTVSSRALAAFRDYLARYVASAGFTTLARETRDRKDALGRIRYCTRIKGDRVEVTRYADEADYSAVVLRTFERFKQGAVKDYLIRYRTRPGMNHVAAQILERVARLFPEEFAALDEYCSRHAAFLDEGIRHAHRELQFYLAYLDYIRPLRDCRAELLLPRSVRELEGRPRRWHIRPSAGPQACYAGHPGSHQRFHGWRAASASPSSPGPTRAARPPLPGHSASFTTSPASAARFRAAPPGCSSSIASSPISSGKRTCPREPGSWRTT